MVSGICVRRAATGMASIGPDTRPEIAVRWELEERRRRTRRAGSGTLARDPPPVGARAQGPGAAVVSALVHDLPHRLRSAEQHEVADQEGL